MYVKRSLVSIIVRFHFFLKIVDKIRDISYIQLVCSFPTKLQDELECEFFWETVKCKAKLPKGTIHSVNNRIIF